MHSRPGGMIALTHQVSPHECLAVVKTHEEKGNRWNNKQGDIYKSRVPSLNLRAYAFFFLIFPYSNPASINCKCSTSISSGYSPLVRPSPEYDCLPQDCACHFLRVRFSIRFPSPLPSSFLSPILLRLTNVHRGIFLYLHFANRLVGWGRRIPYGTSKRDV